jgi:ribose transport system permease protein
MIVSELSGSASRDTVQRSSIRVNWSRLVESFALLAATAALFAGFGILNPTSFLSWTNISTMLGSQSILVVLSLALIVPLTAGDFDLSIASVMSLSAMVVALLNVHGEWPVGLAIVVGLGVGALTGLVNAAFILYFRIPSLIVTLGTSTFLAGMVLWISGSNTVTGVSSTLVQWIVVTRILGIPIAFFYAFLLAVSLWYFLEYTTAGRRLLFVGRSREVARLSGISVDRARLLSFVSSGIISAAAGVMYAGMMGAADPVSGQTFLLPAFAAAFLGATSINPGRFNAWGAFIAVYFLVVGITGLTMLGVDTYVQNLFYGGALVLAVSLSQLVRKREPQDFT